MTLDGEVRRSLRHPPPHIACSPVRGIVRETTVSYVLPTSLDRFSNRRSDEMAAVAERHQPRSAAVGRLFVLEVSGGRIHSMNPDGSDRKVIVTGCELPDGIAIDVAAGHIYWTNMGASVAANDGSIERADLDGSNRKLVVAPAPPLTPT